MQGKCREGEQQKEEEREGRQEIKEDRRQKQQVSVFCVLPMSQCSAWMNFSSSSEVSVGERVWEGYSEVGITLPWQGATYWKNRWMWMQILLNVIFFFHAGGWQQPNQSSLWNYSRDFTQTLLGSEHFVQKSVNVSFCIFPNRLHN